MFIPPQRVGRASAANAQVTALAEYLHPTRAVALIGLELFDGVDAAGAAS